MWRCQISYEVYKKEGNCCHLEWSHPYTFLKTWNKTLEMNHVEEDEGQVFKSIRKHIVRHPLHRFHFQWVVLSFEKSRKANGAFLRCHGL